MSPPANRRPGWRTGPSLALALLVTLAACTPERDAPARLELAPSFEVQMLDGTPRSLAQLRGKTVLIDFWATWCPPCVVEVPELNAVWERVKDRDVEILAISIDTLPLDEVAAWAREQDVRYPVALGDVDLALAYGGEQFPYHVLVGPDGEILERLDPGFHDRDELMALLERHGKI